MHLNLKALFQLDQGFCILFVNLKERN